MSKIVHVNVNDVSAAYVCDHPGYEYHKRKLAPFGVAQRSSVAAYEIPPGKSAYPYHYHTFDEEAFYIIAGRGLIKTPDGDKTIKAGDFLFFPANATGAHKITNTSETEMLIYIDFATFHEIDVAVYPDSGKIGVWGGDINKVFKTENAVDYYEEE
ncbi:MAG: cupin domain-containing protein [Defluviitaleaceae bacterium]|nr:cupin domain-containing protein [Defluviitaleaceae bacterium]